MDTVQVHCYGCQAAIPVDSGAPEDGLRAGGWSLAHGETYCPTCASARGLPPLDPAGSTREGAMLDRLQGRAMLRVKVGAVAGVAGLLLLTDLSSSPVGVAAGAVAVMGGPLALLWGERTRQLARQGIAIYLGLMVFLFAYALVHSSGVSGTGVIFGWGGIVVGPVFVWTGLRDSKLVGVARGSLNGPTYDVGLEIRVRRGYGGQPFTNAVLSGVDSPTPLAWFGRQMSEPEFLALDRTSAKVYGTPIRRAVVVVSCPEAVVAGRIRRSHFGESPSSKPVSPLVAWLWKPRSLRLP